MSATQNLVSTFSSEDVKHLPNNIGQVKVGSETPTKITIVREGQDDFILWSYTLDGKLEVTLTDSSKKEFTALSSTDKTLTGTCSVIEITNKAGRKSFSLQR